MRFLEGYRIVELATAVQGGGAGAALADLGATVIKVEEPAGDFQRHFRALAGVQTARPKFEEIICQAFGVTAG